MVTTMMQVAGRDSDEVALSSRQLDELRAGVDGPVLRPGDGGWDDACEIWNAMIRRTPALVARPGSTSGVAHVVSFAREHGVLLAIKGGGHNIAGTSMAPGGLTLDMSRMREVRVDPGARLAHVAAGALLRDVDRAAQAHALATPLGFVSNVGAAGLTLGGGFGYLTRRFGWTVDNLEEVEIVTADGAVRVANRNRDPNLFWAIRGGGGNFGVVTRFTYRLHAVGPSITGGLIAWSGERSAEVLTAYRALVADAPPELTAVAIIRRAPPAPFIPPPWHGRRIVGVLVCHSGTEAAADLEPLRTLGDPIFDSITERPYVEQQSMLDALDRKGNHQYWKTEYLPGLSDEYLDAFRTAALRLTSPLSFAVIFPIGGAINERARDDGAVGNRDARFVSGFSGVWTPEDARGAEHVEWVRNSWQAIRPFSTGGNYVNFQLAEDEADRIAAAYGANLERLQHVKAEYDPSNLFRVNRNILPAG